MKSILNENEKQKLLENFQVSGMTQAAFAVENGINPKTLARWIYQSRLQEKQTKPPVPTARSRPFDRLHCSERTPCSTAVAKVPEAAAGF